MARILIAVVALVTVVALTPVTAGGEPVVVLPRSTVDRPDDFAGLQVHMVYAVPSDGIDRGFDSDGSIQNAVDSFQRWVSARTGGRTYRVDTYQGLADVTFRRMATPDHQYPFVPIITDLQEAGLIVPGKVYGVYYEGGAPEQQCGGASWPQWPEPATTTVAAIYLGGLGGACFLGFPPPGGQPNYTVFSMFHDVTHTFGIVGQCAPHHYAANPGHVNDSNTDLMYGGPLGWNPSVVDFGNDDYFRASIPGCVDLDNVGFLSRPTSSTVTVQTDVRSGPGKVVSSPWPLIDCGARCTASYPIGTIIALNAMPDGDSTFAGWGGACAGTTRCLLTVDSDKTVTARFTAPDRSVFASTSGSGLGTVTSRPQGIRCPRACTRSFPNGSAIEMRAAPGPGSRFDGWNSDCSGRACSFTLDDDKVVEARFADIQKPRAIALPSLGTPGGVARIRYRISENTGVARVSVRVVGVRRVRRSAYKRVSARRTYAISVRVPRSAQAVSRFCVRAFDRAGHKSRRSCARLTLG